MNALAVSASAQAPTVLLVDDATSSLKLHAAILRHAGYRVLATETAIDAVILLSRETPDVILLDYMLPIMDAPMFLREIRKDPRLVDVPVILLTASSEEDHIEAAFAAGGDDYLTKPIDRRILLARVKATIDARRDRQRATLTSTIARERDALLREVDEARLLQSSLLPACPMRWDGWALHGALVPCGLVGGDLFDVVIEDKNERMIILIDVSGHGLASAMVASGVRSCLHLLRNGELSQVLAALNRHLCQRDDLYACVTVLRVSRDYVTIVNAGLPPVAVIEGGAVTHLFGPNGSPPGLVPDAEYDVIQIERRPGIRFVAMSDGITEPFGLADDTPSAVARLGLLAPLDPRGVCPAAQIRGLFPRGDAQPDDATLVVLCDERAPDSKSSDAI